LHQLPDPGETAQQLALCQRIVARLAAFFFVKPVEAASGAFAAVGAAGE
jgi:hypothetical protein